MALATKCPHCNTIFRVAADQLKLRGGIVRCGACKEVFDGNAALVDTAAVPLPARPAVAAEPEPAIMPEPAPRPAETGSTLDFDTSLDPFGLLPATPPGVVNPQETSLTPEPALPEAKPVAVAPHAIELDLELDFEIDFDIDIDATAVEPKAPVQAPTQAEAPPNEGRREPGFDVEPEEHLVAAPLPDHEDVRDSEQPTAADSEPEAGIADDGAALPSRDVFDAGTDTQSDDEDEPGFVRRGRRRERLGRLTRIGMAVGSVLLLAALLAQGLTTFRNQLAANVPQLKPVLLSACSLFGCRVEVPAQIEALSIEQGELQTLGENTFSYASILHNQSASAQAWPSIELTLNDAADKPVLRRVLSPRDYLAPTVDLSKGFAPHAEQAVKLYFELAQLKASGYHIAIFYP